MFKNIIKNTKNKIPLIHSITNFVTVNDVANIILASGATPAMANYYEDATDLQKISSALLLNTGDINPMIRESMLEAGKIANKLNHPIILDPVAVGATKYRDLVADELLSSLNMTVIRGNISEIKSIYLGTSSTKGVDANMDDVITEKNLDKNIVMAKKIASKFNSIIAISGAIDIVCDSKKAIVIYNGHSNMAKITGSGCMLTAVIASYVAGNPENALSATATAVIALGISGELAYEKMVKEDTGLSSFRTYLIDYMSKMKNQIIEKGAKYEIR